jgi:tetratricopeptide (TPR) repeat protein
MTVFGGDNPDSYYDEGLTASMRGDLARAIEYFEKCIRMDSTYSSAYHQLGKVYHRLGNSQKAVTFLSQVVSVKPGQVPPRVDLGYAHLSQGNTEKARDLFRMVCIDKPGHARAMLGLAHCAYQSGDREAAVTIAQDQANTGGATFGTFYLLARAAGECGREELVPEAIKRADALIEKSIEGAPDQPEGYYLRGLLQDLLGDLGKALECYGQAVERALPDKHYAAYEEHFSLVDMLGRLGQMQLKAGNETAAAATFARLRELAPESGYLPKLS